MKKQLLAVLLCGTLLTGCSMSAASQPNHAGTSGSANAYTTVQQIDLDDFVFGGCASLSLAGNLAAAKAGNTSYEGARDQTAFTGSSEAAWQRLIDGKLDVALVYAPSEETKEELEKQGISLAQVGTDALVFLAGSSSEEDTPLDWTQQDILTAYQNEQSDWTGYAAAAGSDSRTMFAAVFGFDALGVTILSGKDSLTAACPHTEGTVCYDTWISLLQNGKPEDTNLIAVDGALPGDTANEGDAYPFTVPYYVAVRPGLEQNAPAMLFYRWLSSDTGRTWLLEAILPPEMESNEMSQSS